MTVQICGLSLYKFDYHNMRLGAFSSDNFTAKHGETVKAGMQNGMEYGMKHGMEYGTEYGMRKRMIKACCSTLYTLSAGC